jgi:sugar lactone lactonase YvrE
MRGRLAAALVLASLLVPAAAWGVETQVWEVQTREGFEKGEADGVSITHRGALVLSPVLEELHALEEPLLLAMAAGDGGDLYVATANEGLVLRLPGNGDEPELVLDAEEPMVTALARGPAGVLYAATAPGGAVVRVRPDGEVETLFAPEETYVWDMALGPDGALYVATGDPGNLYRLPPGGEAELLYESPEINLTAVLAAPDGSVYVGGEGEGQVVRVRRGQKADVIYDTPLLEITDLALDPEGNLYVAAFGDPTARKENNKEEEKEAAEGPGALFGIAPDRRISPLWLAREEFFLSLAWSGDRLLAGTGTDGRIYHVKGIGERTMLAETKEEQITVLLPGPGGKTFVGASNLGRVYRLSARPGAAGSYTSPTHGTAGIARWGAVRWDGDVPAGASVRIETRSGETEKPGPGWSEWQEVRREGDRLVTQSPNARRFQWRATLESGRGGASPELRGVEVTYQERNLAPAVVALDIHGPSVVFDKKLAEKSITEESVASFSSEVSPEKQKKKYRLPGWRTVSWKGADPNKDSLTYRLELSRRGGDARWPLADDLAGSSYSWDTRGLEDGWYRIRVTACDSPDNPEGTSLEGWRDSPPFGVDNTPPRVEALRARRRGDGTVVVTFRGRDAGSQLARADLSLDSSPWRPVHPEDGIADEAEERFSVELPDPGPGPHLLAVRLRDRFGNSGAGHASF